MKDFRYNLSIERLSNEDAETEINKFISCGWVYIGNWDLANSHTFAQLAWNKNSDPIYPQGYEKRKNKNPVRADGFL